MDDRASAGELYELYKDWEQSSWAATAVDLAGDAGQWAGALGDLQRRAATWNYSMFLVGVNTEARVLPVLLDAFAGRPLGVLLATQVADEARNRVFLDRFVREVAGQGRDPESTLQASRAHVTWGFAQILAELERLGEALRRKPRDERLAAQIFACCHLVIEGVLAVPGEHFVSRYLAKAGLMPGLAQGLAAVARAEARHVALGMIGLRALVASSKEARAGVVETLNKILPWMVGVFVPPGMDESYVECFDFSLVEIYAFGLRAFEQRVAEVGIDPAELFLLARDDRSLSYEERARRVLTLVRDGVIGDDRREPEVSRASFEILFEGMARATDLATARSLEGPVEWSFTDAEPWHLVVTDDHVEAKPGRAGEPALRLESSAADWAKMVVGRADARWGLLTRRLKVHGPFAAKKKLPKLFN